MIFENITRAWLAAIESNAQKQLGLVISGNAEWRQRVRRMDRHAGMYRNRYMHGFVDRKFDHECGVQSGTDKCPGNDAGYRQAPGNICNSVKSNRQAGVVDLSIRGTTKPISFTMPSSYCMVIDTYDSSPNLSDYFGPGIYLSPGIKVQ